MGKRTNCLWLLILNGFIAFILWLVPVLNPGEAPSPSEGLEVFMMFLGFFGAIGVMVLTQGAIVGEKRSGTAAWILSNPVARSAFILSKLIGNAMGILAILVVLQGLVAYSQISLRGKDLLPPIPFVAAMGLQSLHLLFYLTLALMLGTFFNARGPVIGISIGFLIAQNLLGQLLAGFVPWLPLVLPESVMTMAVPVAQGQTLPSEWPIPIIAISLMSVAFTLVAIWRFQREEF